METFQTQYKAKQQLNKRYLKHVLSQSGQAF